MNKKPEKLTVSFQLIETIPEIQLIQLLMDASIQFDNELTKEEKDRAIAYFQNWHKQAAS